MKKINLTKLPKLQLITLILPGLLLLISSTYSIVKAVHTYATGSDALVYTYLLDGAHLNQIVLPGQHANIFKLPFFWLTSLFPYNYRTFMIASVLLVLASIALWAWLLIRLFGKRYAPLIMVLLASLIFSSTFFSINVAENTIRNIEFPVALWFIMIVNDVLKGKAFTVNQKRLSVLGSLLYGLLLSGDNYFMVACSLPLLGIIVWYWLQSRRFTRPMFMASGLILATVALGVLIKALLTATGLVVINQHIIFPLTVVSSNNLAPSITTAATQLLQLQGADIFGQTLSLHTISLFVNFALLVLGIIGLFSILYIYSAQFRKRQDITRDNGFVFMVLAASFAISFLVYVFSGQVVNGIGVSLGQARYIAFMPLLSIVGFIWLLHRYYGKHTRLTGLVIAVLLVQIITVYPSTRNTFFTQINTAQPSLGILHAQEAYLKKQHVSQVLSGYWDGSPLRFASNDDIRFATIVDCNHPFTFNVRKDWYKPSKQQINTALLVDRTGPDQSYWDCSDDQLRDIYGDPVSIKTIGQTSIWVYNYDTRQKLEPYALTYRRF